jgi:hypothetical protein
MCQRRRILTTLRRFEVTRLLAVGGGGVLRCGEQRARADAEEPGLLLLAQAVALAADVEHVAVVKQTIEDSGGGQPAPPLEWTESLR